MTGTTAAKIDKSKKLLLVTLSFAHAIIIPANIILAKPTHAVATHSRSFL